jgi:hypothetical protein
VGLERGPLSLLSTIEELLERECSGSGLEIREYVREDPLHWPRDTFYPQSGGRSVGVVCSLAEAMEFSFFICWHRVALQLMANHLYICIIACAFTSWLLKTCSRSRSYFTTDDQSVSQYVFVSSPLWDLWPDISSCRKVAVWKLRSCFCLVPSLTRGCVCSF